MKLYLAVSDVKHVNELLVKLKPKYLLYSFFHTKKVPNFPFAKSIIYDSGAHTLQKGKNVDFDWFVYEYVQAIKRQPWITYYVELDIENRVGLKMVERWRERMEWELERPPIVVWHRERGKDYWLYMVKKYPYVGFSGFVGALRGELEVPEENIGWFLKTASEYGAKVHGFGATRIKWLFKYPFYSVDSATWTLASSSAVAFDRKGLKISQKKIGRKQNVKVNYKSRMYKSLTFWINLADEVEQYWKNKK